MELLFRVLETTIAAEALKPSVKWWINIEASFAKRTELVRLDLRSSPCNCGEPASRQT